jgi:hypothetical protein
LADRTGATCLVSRFALTDGERQLVQAEMDAKLARSNPIFWTTALVLWAIIIAALTRY